MTHGLNKSFAIRFYQRERALNSKRDEQKTRLARQLFVEGKMEQLFK